MLKNRVGAHVYDHSPAFSSEGLRFMMHMMPGRFPKKDHRRHLDEFAPKGHISWHDFHNKFAPFLGMESEKMFMGDSTREKKTKQRKKKQAKERPKKKEKERPRGFHW